jgi:hypothetical protein
VLGLGLGGDHDRLVVVLAGFPGRPYLEAEAAEARAIAHDAARIAARRPLRSLATRQGGQALWGGAGGARLRPA